MRQELYTLLEKLGYVPAPQEEVFGASLKEVFHKDGKFISVDNTPRISPAGKIEPIITIGQQQYGLSEISEETLTQAS